MRVPMGRLLSLALMGAVLAGCANAGSGLQTVSPAPPTPSSIESTSAADYRPVQYADATNWLCRPGKSGTPCTGSRDAASVAADGSITSEPSQPADDPPIDCFYVYPTVSQDDGDNSDLMPGPEEWSVVAQQAARFASVCRLFVPIYRQITTTALVRGRYGNPGVQAVAYTDVLAAWKHYLAQDNDGRGFVLLGHSQGGLQVKTLIRDEIDPDPRLRSQLVSAMILGWTVQVPFGADKGGDFANVPACRRPDQVNCVVAYASFAADAPPPADSVFGRTSTTGTEALCVNPAALSGGPGDLHPYFSQAMSRALKPDAEQIGLPATAAYVTYPGLLRGECVREGGASYLKVTTTRGPDDRRPTLTFSKMLGPQWGLHIYDVELALGDMIALVARQSVAYRTR